MSGTIPNTLRGFTPDRSSKPVIKIKAKASTVISQHEIARLEKEEKANSFLTAKIFPNDDMKNTLWEIFKHQGRQIKATKLVYRVDINNPNA
jgi:hypothetical protein